MGIGLCITQKKLVTLQKRAIRIISGKSRTDHSGPLFKQLRIMKLHDVNSYLIAMFMYKFYHEKLPEFFKDMFHYNSSIHNYNTRQNSDVHVPLVKSNLMKMSIRYAGAIIWNKIIHLTSYSCTIETFKKKVKTLFIDNY